MTVKTNDAAATPGRAIGELALRLTKVTPAPDRTWAARTVPYSQPLGW
jgi:hypothetical protein